MTLRSASVKAVQETSEIFILVDTRVDVGFVESSMDFTPVFARTQR